MIRRRKILRKDDRDLRRARRLIVRAQREFDVSIGEQTPRQEHPTAARRQLSPNAKRRLLGLIAELDLVIKALRRQREDIGQEAGIVFRNRQVASAYGRVGQILRQDRHARRNH